MLYGAVYGDIAGSAYEFHPVKDDNFSTISKKHETSSPILLVLVYFLFAFLLILTGFMFLLKAI